MPWHLPEDMRHFTELTVSHPVIMGRKTWESLSPKFRPLPNRDNIVISHDPSYFAPGATVVDSLDDALDLARQEAIPDDGLDRSEIWVIGGAKVFEEAMPFADKAYVTQISMHVNADTYAPDIHALVESGAWRVAEEGTWQKARKGNDCRRLPFRDVRKKPRGVTFHVYRDDRVHGQHLPFAHG